MACSSRASSASVQPTASEHLPILVDAGLVTGKRIKQWTFYKRNERRIAQVKREFRGAW